MLHLKDRSAICIALHTTRQNIHGITKHFLRLQVYKCSHKMVEIILMSFCLIFAAFIVKPTTSEELLRVFGKESFDQFKIDINPDKDCLQMPRSEVSNTMCKSTHLPTDLLITNLTATIQDMSLQHINGQWSIHISTQQQALGAQTDYDLAKGP